MSDSKIVTYDLRAPGRDYKDLIARLNQYDSACRVCESTWLLKCTWSCKQIRDDLLGYMDSNDRIFVAALNGEAAWHNVICGTQSTKTALP